MANYINVTIHSNLSEFPTEKRYPSEIKISDLKEKLELVTGCNHKSMTIELSVDGQPDVLLDNDDQTLHHYIGETPSKDSLVKLSVKDDSSKDLLSGDVPHVTISEEKYAQRPNVRDFIKEIKGKPDHVQKS